MVMFDLESQDDSQLAGAPQGAGRKRPDLRWPRSGSGLLPAAIVVLAACVGLWIWVGNDDEPEPDPQLPTTDSEVPPGSEVPSDSEVPPESGDEDEDEDEDQPSETAELIADEAVVGSVQDLPTIAEASLGLDTTIFARAGDQLWSVDLADGASTVRQLDSWQSGGVIDGRRLIAITVGVLFGPPRDASVVVMDLDTGDVEDTGVGLDALISVEGSAAVGFNADVFDVRSLVAMDLTSGEQRVLEPPNPPIDQRQSLSALSGGVAFQVGQRVGYWDGTASSVLSDGWLVGPTGGPGVIVQSCDDQLACDVSLVDSSGDVRIAEVGLDVLTGPWSPTGWTDRPPSISPDHRHIAATAPARGPDALAGRLVVRVADLVDGKLVRSVTTDSSHSSAQPVWFPDGSHVVLADGSSVQVVGVDGADPPVRIEFDTEELVEVIGAAN